ncbi:hypothetical protein GGI21_000142 [Coemansia aciculifera]|nr:hypothetical protein GGI21_000142 [Coemansia aciculifera]
MAGENRSYGFHQSAYDTEELLKEIAHVYCDAVWEFAAPCTWTHCLKSRDLAIGLVLDLESRLFSSAISKRPGYAGWSKEHGGDQLSKWVNGILEWTVYSALSVSTSGWQRTVLWPTPLSAASIGPCSESLLLFAAYHVKAYVGQKTAAGLLEPEDCRFTLLIVNKDAGVRKSTSDSDDEYYDDVNDQKDLVRATFGMFPLNNDVERQGPPASQHIVANAEIASTQDEFEAAVARLAKDTKSLYFSQHNRRFAWGLTVCCRTDRAYIYGPDMVWTSTNIDVTTAAGHQALISLLVNWSLCSIAYKMHEGPLRSLAVALYEALFLYQKCPGAVPATSQPDPLKLRNDYERQIVERLQAVLVKHKELTLATHEISATPKPEATGPSIKKK